MSQNEENTFEELSCSNAHVNDTAYYQCPCCDFFEPSYALLFPWVVELVGVMTAFLLIQTNAPLSHAAVMFLLGVGLGAVATLQTTGCCNAFLVSTLQWTQIDSNVLLLTILPGLILRDAMEVDFDVFMMASGQLLLLAYPMVLLGTALTAVATFYCMPWDLPWSLTLTLGSILGSTDPIAVNSVLKRLGAPPRLQLHLAGESTLNDGSAMVFFNVFSQMWFASLPGTSEEPITVGQGFALFFQNALGGLAVGIAFAVGLLIALYQLDKRLEPEYDILQAAAAVTFSYLSYYVADQLLSMSGVTASVTCAVLAKAFGKGMIQDEVGMIHYLSLMEFLLNTLLFALGGVVWGGLLTGKAADGYFSATGEWFWLLVMFVLVMVIRFVQVAVVYPVLSRIGLKTNPREAIFLGFAGMRGAVGIALALSLYRKATSEFDLSDENTALVTSIFFISGGISLCTLLFNGTAAPWVLKWLKLVEPDDRKRAIHLFEIEAQDYMSVQYTELLALPRFHGACHASILKHVPFVTEMMPEEAKPDNHPKKPAHGKGHRRNTSEVGDMVHLQNSMTRRVRQLSGKSSLFEEGSIASISGAQEILRTEMRRMFLEMVYHIYVRKLNEGEIDDDQQNLQNNPAWMKQNLKTFFNNDGKAVANEANAPSGVYWWNRLEHIVKRIITGKAKRSDFFDGEVHSEKMSHVRESRPAIQRMLAFIGAHRSAERNFSIYMKTFLTPDIVDAGAPAADGGESGQFTSGLEGTERSSLSPGESAAMKEAVKVVLQESQEQVMLARMELATMPANDVRRVQSHTVASILLKRLTKFVASKVADDSLTPKEAQVYIDKIASEKDGLQECTGDEVIHQPSAPTETDDLDDDDIIKGYLDMDTSHQRRGSLVGVITT
jgi:NhaP-type Na+/H+ or K+/H+ antiporter